MSLFFEVCILTTVAAGTPHAEALVRANPEVVLHIHRSPKASGAAHQESWRNADRPIRDWWIKRREKVAADFVLFLEWDVYANIDLRTVFTEEMTSAGLVAPCLKSAVTDRRAWQQFDGISRLPDAIRPHACGVEPLAVILLSRAALDAISSPEWDDVFALDLYGDLRLPTLVRHSGFDVVASTRMPDVGTRRMTPRPGDRGVFHSVKKEVER